MSYATVRYTGTGSTTTFAVPFPYLSATHVEIYLAGIQTTAFTLPDLGTALLSSPPANGVLIEIRRNTPKVTPLATYSDASTLTATDLMLNANQSIYVTQESIDTSEVLMKHVVGSLDFDASNALIRNVNDPQVATDAATKSYTDTVATAAKAFATTSDAALRVALVTADDAVRAYALDLFHDIAPLGAITPGTIQADFADVRAVSVTTNQHLDAVATVGTYSIGRNKARNGTFTVAQRGDGPFTNHGYNYDGWSMDGAGSSTVSRITLSDTDRNGIGDESASIGLQIVTAGAGGANDFDVLNQRIEFVRALSGLTLTLSFWARTTTGTTNLGVSLDQYLGSGGSPSARVNGTGVLKVLTTAWQRISVTTTLASMIGRTLGTAGNDFTQINLWVSSGTTNASRTGNIGVQSNTVQLWGVQFEEGVAATPLERRSYPAELLICQRLFQVGQAILTSYSAFAGSALLFAVPTSCTFRAVPTFSITNNISSNVGQITLSIIAGGGIFASGTNSNAGNYLVNASFTASAEL